MVRILKHTAYSLLTLLLLSTCKTDVEVIGPKRDMCVIYGLLEAQQARHYIRINRAFVGEEAASILAAKPGINEYADRELQAYVEELREDGSGSVIRSWELKPTFIYDKDEGNFYSDSNKVYFFDADLEPGRIYRLLCLVTVEGEDPKTVSATTTVLGKTATSGGLEAITLVKPNLVGQSADPSNADRSEVDFVGNGDYITNYEVTWGATTGGALYTSFYRFYYREVDTITGETHKDSIVFTVGSVRKDPSSVLGSVSFTMNPKVFFEKIDREVEDYDHQNATFKRIASDTIQFFLEISDYNLATYMEVNQPKTEIVQEQPEYTNIENGIGIFASRYITSTRRKGSLYYISGRVLKQATFEELLFSNNIIESNREYQTNQKGFTSKRCNSTTQDCK